MKIFFFTISLLLISLVSTAQGLHLNLFLGTSNYRGDLQDKSFSFDQAHLAGGIGFSYDLSDRLSVRANFKMGKISADDEKGRNKTRNLNFNSLLTEGDI
ncbi:MAG: DUF6089 family protein, partial [Ginsengibacter sp.]